MMGLVDGDGFVLSLWCEQKPFAFAYASDSLVCTHVLFFEWWCGIRGCYIPIP